MYVRDNIRINDIVPCAVETNIGLSIPDVSECGSTQAQ